MLYPPCQRSTSPKLRLATWKTLGQKQKVTVTAEVRKAKALVYTLADMLMSIHVQNK